MNRSVQIFRRSLGAAAAAGALACQQAMAALPEGVEAEVTTAGTDANTIGAAVLVVIIGIFALKLVRRAL